jgi:hypothetical protein
MMTRAEAQELANHLKAAGVALRDYRPYEWDSHELLAGHLLTLAGSIEHAIDAGRFRVGSGGNDD